MSASRRVPPPELRSFIHALVPRDPEYEATAGATISATDVWIWGASAALDVHWNVYLADRAVVQRHASSPPMAISLVELDFAAILLAMAAAALVTG